MHEALWVLVGVFIGAPLGLVIGGMLCSGKVTDMETEIMNLRFQRKALREEIDIQTSPKPKPLAKALNDFFIPADLSSTACTFSFLIISENTLKYSS